MTAQESCSICLESIGNHKEMNTGCTHHYHTNCMRNVNMPTEAFSCPLCKDHEYLHQRFEYDGHQCCDTDEIDTIY
eukprot:Awhi_evm1s6270